MSPEEVRAAVRFCETCDDDELNEAKFDIVDVKTQAEADAFPTLSALIEAAIAG